MRLDFDNYYYMHRDMRLFLDVNEYKLFEEWFLWCGDDRFQQSACGGSA